MRTISNTSSSHMLLKLAPTLCYLDLPLLHRTDSPPPVDTKHWQRASRRVLDAWSPWLASFPTSSTNCSLAPPTLYFTWSKPCSTQLLGIRKAQGGAECLALAYNAVYAVYEDENTYGTDVSYCTYLSALHTVRAASTYIHWKPALK